MTLSPKSSSLLDMLIWLHMLESLKVDLSVKEREDTDSRRGKAGSDRAHLYFNGGGGLLNAPMLFDL